MEHRCRKKKVKIKDKKTKGRYNSVRQNKNENKSWEKSVLWGAGAEGVGGQGSQLIKAGGPGLLGGRPRPLRTSIMSSEKV